MRIGASTPEKEIALKALSKLGYEIGDVVAILQGFQEGGVLGGLQAGFSADAFAQLLHFLPGPALYIGIAVALAAAFFGGNHDNPATMPDKYDTQNYGQGVANLQGAMGANGESFTEDQHLVNLFGGRTGVQMVEETLAQYGTSDNAPQWLKPIFNELEAKFGESATGSGVLSIGDGGSGKHCNNQQIVGIPGTDGQVYQYSQLDSALAEFQAAYANARAAGQAVALTWDSAAAPGSAPPSENYTSTSYQSREYLA